MSTQGQKPSYEELLESLLAERAQADKNYELAMRAKALIETLQADYFRATGKRHPSHKKD